MSDPYLRHKKTPAATDAFDIQAYLIDVISTSVMVWRWPNLTLYPFLDFNFNLPIINAMTLTAFRRRPACR
jgi:hypothetical protein